MAKLNDMQRHWVDAFLAKTNSRSAQVSGDGVATTGLASFVPGDGEPGEKKRADKFLGEPLYNSADSTLGDYTTWSTPDEPQGPVKGILVEMTPPPGVNLPTLHGAVELVSEDLKSTKQVSRGEILKKPEYIDNFTKATLKVPPIWDMKDANKLTLNLFYSASQPVSLPWPLLRFQWEQPAYSYGRNFGKIIPQSHDGNSLFDKNNTPSLILAALFFKDELDKLAEKYEEIAHVTYIMGGAVAGSAGHLNGARVGNFSGGRYGKTSRSGSKGAGTAGKPPTGSGTGRTGTTQRTNTGGRPTGGAGTTGKPTSGDDDALPSTSMRLDEPKHPARSGSTGGKGGGGGTRKPGGGDSSFKGTGSGEKGKTPVKADRAKGHTDDGDPGKAAGKNQDPKKTDKRTADEGKTVKVSGGSKDSKDEGAKGDSKTTGNIKPSGSGSVIRRSAQPTGGGKGTTVTTGQPTGTSGPPKPGVTTPPTRAQSPPTRMDTTTPTAKKGPPKPATTTNTPAGPAGKTPPTPATSPAPKGTPTPPAPEKTTTLSPTSGVSPAKPAPKDATNNPAKPAGKSPASVLSNEKLKKVEASDQVKLANQNARPLGAHEEREAIRIGAVLDDVNSGKREMAKVQSDFSSQGLVQKLEGKMSAAYSGYTSLSLSSPEARGGKYDIMRLLYRYDATNKKVFGIRIVQMHPYPK